MQLLRSFGEAEVFCDCDEIPELSKFHRTAPTPRYEVIFRIGNRSNQNKK